MRERKRRVGSNGTSAPKILSMQWGPNSILGHPLVEAVHYPTELFHQPPEVQTENPFILRIEAHF